jgi:D-inositol-3-phosphate glycosyltransferase
LGLAGHVHFLGHQPVDKVQDWLAASDLFALTSMYESFSIATIEAMAHGLPIIATATGYLTELVTAARAGRLVALDDSGSLADALVEFAQNPSQRAEFGSCARTHSKRFAWENVANNLERLYESATSGACTTL